MNLCFRGGKTTTISSLYAEILHYNLHIYLGIDVLLSKNHQLDTAKGRRRRISKLPFLLLSSEAEVSTDAFGRGKILPDKAQGKTLHQLFTTCHSR